MKPETIRYFLANIDNAIAMNHLIRARQLIKELDEAIFISQDDVKEMCPADLGEFGLEKEGPEVIDE